MNDLVSLTHDGVEYVAMSEAELQEIGVPQAVIDEAMQAAAQSAARNKLRAGIDAAAGDIPSLLGTTADGAQLAVYGLASLVAKLATAQSLAEVREAAAPFAAMSADFLTKVESGEVKLPFMIKGVEAVVADIETRATAVSEALEEAAGA